ncbi:MAG: antitoxin [Anaerotruncus sp.]|nr:antitoxin [Anaerotruncus sp.]
MADILKITTPLVNKAQAMDPKKTVEISPQFDLHNISKVVKPASQEEILQQNNGMNQEEGTSALLLNLLKDPSVTVGSLKNIFLLQEMIKLLPVNNQTFTQEIEQMFDQLLVPPDQIAQEMLRQENVSTIFKGEMFDFLREMLAQNPEQGDLRAAVVNFLKSLNYFSSREAMLDSVANSLGFLSQSLESSKTLSQQLATLAQRFRGPDAQYQFDGLKRQLLSLFSQVEDSILFSPKLAKVLSITVYNLSRYNDNTEFFQDSISQVLSQLRGDEARGRFMGYVEQFLREGAPQDQGHTVMDVLARIIHKQAESDELMLMNSEKIEKVIRSLLSSPCNFTPLLHFVIPVQYEDLRSFAEIWINVNGQEDDRSSKKNEKSTHLLLVFDISDIGRFEMELYVRDKTIDLSLFCPAAYVRDYAGVGDDLSKSLRGLGYRFGDVMVDRLERPRSLMDVFRSLPYRRTGVDVKI